jgi:SHS2 domain-containing protein
MYEIFEHTADLGIRIRADNYDELFADAARGLFSVMVSNLDSVRKIVGAEFQVQGSDIEELLHDWMAELLYAFHARREVYAEFQVHVTEDGLTAWASGEPIDVARHEIDEEVKAITWCGLKVVQEEGRWMAEVIVDI